MNLRDQWRIWTRFLRFGYMTFVIVMRVLINGVNPRGTLAKGMEIRRQWAEKFMSGIYNFRVERKGDLPEGQHLFVSNHRGSIDPIVHMQYLKACPVSRADVANYPLVGIGSKKTGIIFVDKANRKSRAATKVAIGKAMQEGLSVLLFPEGHTHRDPTTRRLHVGSFRVAAENNVPIFPMAISYKDPEDAWIHDSGLMEQFNKQFGRRKETFVKIRYGSSIPAGDPDEMMKATREWMDQQILEMRAEWDAEESLVTT